MQQLLSAVRQKIPISLVLFFCLLPFSHILFIKDDIWAAHGSFVQLSVLILFFMHLFSKNRPLATLFLWSGLVTLFYWVNITITQNAYPAKIFFPFFNFFVIIILYEMIILYSDTQNILKIYKYLGITLFIILIYSILQKLSLDQFYKALDNRQVRDEIVGTIGNPMHLSHFICMLIPTFILFKQNICKLLVVFAFAVIILTGSVSGIVIAVLVVAFISLYYRIFSLREIILIGIASLLAFVLKYEHFKNFIVDFTNSSGRFDMFKKYYSFFSGKAITGYGLGIVSEISRTPQFTGWRHVHFELFQSAIEIGLIGVSIIIWGIVDYIKNFIRLPKDKILIVSAGSFLAFVLCSLFGYPAHIWLLSTIGMFSYAALFVFKKGVLNANIS